MHKNLLLLLVLAGWPLPGLGQRFTHTPGQRFLYFRKNGHREAVYGVGEVVTFELRGTGQKVSDRLVGLEDSLLVFQHYTVSPKAIAALYVDEKTRQWFILRYKYEKLFLLAGALFLPIDLVNSRKIEPRAVEVSGAFLGAALLAHWLISPKLNIKGRRRLVIISY